MRISTPLTLSTVFAAALSQSQPPSTESLITTASQIAQSLPATLPNPSIALVPQPYFWWQSGLLTSALQTYSTATLDTQFVDLARNTLLSQAGAAADFMMPDAHGNDDQTWWALSALSFAETGVQQTPEGTPTFLGMAQAVFAEQKARWDEATCGGGLRFKIVAGEKGYEYKSSIANGLFFQLAARLARTTGDADAVAWAEKSWAWVEGTGLIDADFNVYDGAGVGNACADVNGNKWSYNAGVFLYGAAVMATLTGEEVWMRRTEGLLGAAVRNFVREGALVETLCEEAGTCNNDQVSFKGILAQWMGATAVEVPGLRDEIAEVLEKVAAGVQARWTPGGDVMTQFVALESVDAALRARGGVDAAAWGMIGGSKNVNGRRVRRSLAGRILWEKLE